MSSFEQIARTRHRPSSVMDFTCIDQVVARLLSERLHAEREDADGVLWPVGGSFRAYVRGIPVDSAARETLTRTLRETFERDDAFGGKRFPVYAVQLREVSGQNYREVMVIGDRDRMREMK